MRITILTPSFNQAGFIEENILSVVEQSYPDVEHIVIDGGSTDDTIEFLKKYPHLKWVSEKDEGQADALQKGLKMATGDIIGWINSDDYLEKDVLQKVAVMFETSEVDWIVGNLTFVDERKKTSTPDKSRSITKKALFSNPDCLRQQGTFFRKPVLEKVGGFDKKYHLCMDLDLWFRLLKLSDPIMIDEKFAYFRIHENQKTSGKQNTAQLKEMLEIFDKNGSGWFYKLKLCYRKIMFGFRLKCIQCIRK
jgi:glycosyltransferase involved in cell wall biosynthesis